MKRSDILVLAAFILLAPHSNIYVCVALGVFCFGMAAWHRSRGN